MHSTQGITLNRVPFIRRAADSPVISISKISSKNTLAPFCTDVATPENDSWGTLSRNNWSIGAHLFEDIDKNSEVYV